MIQLSQLKKLLVYSLFLTPLFIVGTAQKADSISDTRYWVKIKAHDKFERSVIANYGLSIEYTSDDYVIAFATQSELKKIESHGWVIAKQALTANKFDYPTQDAEYHNYAELKAALIELNQKNPTITQLFSAGKSREGRDLLGIRISGNLSAAKDLPGIIFMGGHHAREHLSVDTPLRIAKHLLAEYAKGNQRIITLINSRDVHVIPAVNPDGMEYDISTGRYKYWRKNRANNNDGTFGVDLNRNYSYGWGTGGSSNDTSSDVYMGPSPFSEPETQAIKKYIESNTNISILLSFHTFSQLILYPWGGKYDPITDGNDRSVHEIMAKKMAALNGYTPQQASDLYIASGDTTDWAYGTHKIISFTFELDPGPMSGINGFYPGAKVIDGVVKKNTEPCLYLIEHADNPYRVLTETL